MASVSEFERAAARLCRDGTLGEAPGEPRQPARFDVRGRGGLAAFELRSDVEPARALSRLIESEIIPRLMVAHRGEQVCSVAAGGAVDGGGIDAAEVAAFAPLTLQIEADALLDHVYAILARGVPVASVLVDLLAPAARLLGELWEDDRCDFVDVTMGLWRLQEVVHEISAGVPAEPATVGHARRALFASMPGDQHSFGSVVIDELFCREGWHTERMNEAARDELRDRVAGDWFDLVGLTISCDCHIASVPATIVALRTASRNPRLCVMVGGRVFGADASANEALAARVGADGTAPDAKLAVEVAGKLVAAIHGEAALS